MDQLPVSNRENTHRDSMPDWDMSSAGAPLLESAREFWGDTLELDGILITIRPPIKPLAMLEKLGPSPFERGSFPLIGFLATTFDKVSQFALERAGYKPDPGEPATQTDIPNG